MSQPFFFRLPSTLANQRALPFAATATGPPSARACGRWHSGGWTLRLLCLLLTLLLSACASVLRVDSDVQSAGRWPAAPQAPQHYQFERSPLQAQGPAAERLTQLQGLVREALARQGWSDAGGEAGADAAHPGAPAAAWQVQLSQQSVPRSDPWRSTYGAAWAGQWALSSRLGRVGTIGLHAPLLLHQPDWLEHSVALLVRQRATGAVVFESRATHLGPWGASPGIWRALVVSALDGFPHPPPGPRQVVLEVPR